MAAGTLVVLAAMAACSSEKPGIPSPVPSSPQATAPSSENREIFAGLDSCETLRAVTASAAYEDYKAETLESDSGCRAMKARYGNVALYFVDNEGIDGLETSQGTKKAIQIDGRDAVQLIGDAGKGNCFIGISVTKSSRATVSLTLSNGTNEQACADGMAVAEQLAPKLPRGN